VILFILLSEYRKLSTWPSCRDPLLLRWFVKAPWSWTFFRRKLRWKPWLSFGRIGHIRLKSLADVHLVAQRKVSCQFLSVEKDVQEIFRAMENLFSRVLGLESPFTFCMVMRESETLHEVRPLIRTSYNGILIMMHSST